MNPNAQAESRKQAEILARNRSIRDAQDIKELMGTKAGRRFIWNVLDMTSVYTQTYAADDRSTSFNEGRRSLGLWVLSQIHLHAFSEYQLMEREHRETPGDQ